jgi:prophage maintenance system killer protein
MSHLSLFSPGTILNPGSTIWRLAERSVITKHLRNVFKEGELAEEAVCAKYAHTAQDGKSYQTMFGNPLYRSREEKAAHLLYFIIKDHPFLDGNKRIGSFIFLLYQLYQLNQINWKCDQKIFCRKWMSNKTTRFQINRKPLFRISKKKDGGFMLISSKEKG